MTLSGNTKVIDNKFNKTNVNSNLYLYGKQVVLSDPDDGMDIGISLYSLGDIITTYNGSCEKYFKHDNGLTLVKNGDNLSVSVLEYSILSENNKTASVTKCNYVPSSKGIAIPSEVDIKGNTYKVTSIDNFAFSQCSGLEEITIPNSVTTIGMNAFRGCTGLTEIEIPDSVTIIDDYTFNNCSGLTKISIPNSVTTIGMYAFKYCTGLTEIEIPDSVTTIDRHAFSDCTGLIKITIPNFVTTIGLNAFNSCTGLTEITIPNSVTTIGEGAFDFCKNLKTINVDENNETYYAEDGVLYSKDKNTLVACPSATGEFEIPKGVTTIGMNSFYSCTGLTGIEIPDSVTTIDDSAFYNCTGLTEITIPDSVTTIDDGAFYNCTGLTEITIPDSVTTIGRSAFGNCFNSNTTIVIPQSVMHIMSSAFDKINFDKVTFKGNLPSIAMDSFAGIEVNTSISEETHIDNNISVDIIGFKNEKTNDTKSFWIGELLKPVVKGYNGTEPLYYRFETDKESEALSFYTSDTFRELSGNKAYYFLDDIYASIQHETYVENYPNWIKCSVYTINKNNEGKFTATLIAESEEISLEKLITNTEDAIKKEFETKNIIVMKQGEKTTLSNLLAKNGFMHITCEACFFNCVETFAYGESDMTVLKVTNGDNNTIITALSDKIGLSKLTFNFYSMSCSYHGTSYSKNNPYKATMYIYVMAEPELSAKSNNITVTDNTVSPAISKYQIGLLNTGDVKDKQTQFSNLEYNKEYDVLQTLSVKVGSEDYTGIYHNYITTEKCFEITNGTIETNKNTNNGYITVNKEKAAAGETVKVTATPNSEYANVSISAFKTGDPTTVVTVFGSSFTMPEYPVTVVATFISPTDAVKNATYSANLTLSKNIDVNLKISNIPDAESKLSITVDGNPVSKTFKDGVATCCLKAVEPNKIGNAIHVVVIYDGVIVKDFNYSVKTYCEAVYNSIDDPDSKLVKLCTAILNYGKYAEDYANEQDLKNGKITTLPAESTINEGHEIDLPSNKDLPSSKRVYTYNTAYGGIGSGAYLGLGSTIKLNYLVKTTLGFAYELKLVEAMDNAKAITQGKYKTGDKPYSQNFYILNDSNEQIDPAKISVSEVEGGYLISVDLYAYQLSNEYTLKVKGVESTEFCIKYGVYDYCTEVQTLTDPKYTVTLKSLCKAIYAYSEAVKAYSAQ